MLDSDNIGRLLFKLSLPAFLGMFVNTLYNVVDTIFIGHYVGDDGIAALTLVFPVQMLALGIGQMTGMGGASLISRLIGGGDSPRAERALGNALFATVVFAGLIMITGLSGVDFWLRLLGSSDDVLPYARDYMTIILTGLAFMTISMTVSGLIRAEGNARVAMTGMIIGAVSNIILDAIFIIPLDMGIKGAALATVIAQLLSVIYLTSYYFTGRSFIKFHFKNLAIEWGILKDIMTIGVASLARTLVGSLSGIIVNRTAVAYGGDIALSAFGIMHRIMMFAIMPGIVTGQGLQPVLGFNYGAHRYDRALKAIKIAFIAATSMCTVVFAVLYFSPEPVIRIFSPDNELVSLSTYVAKRMFLFLYLIGFVMVASLVFQAIGKAVQSFITSIARSALFLIPLVLILPRFMEEEGVWLAFPLTDVLTFLLTLALFIPQVRELIKMNSSTKT